MKNFSVIFDMDGTLLDTQAIFYPAWDFAGELQGYKNLSKHVPNVLGVNEAHCKAYIKSLYPGLDVDRFWLDMIGYAEKNVVIAFKSGAKELLAFLKENGIKFALASGSPHAMITRNLNALGVYNDFDVLVGGMDVQNGKPAPDLFLLAAEKLGANPHDCFVFEDSGNGIRAGHAAGMKCIGIKDTVPFKEEEKALIFKELSSLDQAIELFKEYI